MEKKVSQLASKIAAHNIETGSEIYSTTSVAQNKRLEESLKSALKENNELKLNLQQAKLEVQNQKKILEAELGCDFVNSS